MWSFSRGVEEKVPSWGSVDTRQVKLGEVVQGNKEENQIITPTTHEIIDSRGDSSARTRDG